MSNGLFRSAGANWIGLLTTAVISFFVSGYLVRVLGRDSYGLWALATAVAAQMMLFDGGVRSALVRLLPAQATREDSWKLLALGQRYLVRYAMYGAGLMAAIYFGAPSLFHLDSDSVPLFRILLLVAIIDSIFEVVTGVYDAALAAKERYDWMNSILITRTILTALCVLSALSLGGDILVIALLVVSVRLVQRLVMGRAAASLWGSWSSVRASAAEASPTMAPILGTSLALLVSSRIIHQMDTVIAGMILPVGTVTVVALAVLVTDQLRQLGQSASTVLLPRFSSLSEGDVSMRHELLARWTRIGALLSVSFLVPLVLAGEDLAYWWIGERSGELAILMTLFGAAFLTTFPSFGIQHAILASEHHPLIARCSIGEAVTNLIVSVLLASWYGAWGIAAGTLLAAVIWRGVVLPVVALPLLGISRGRYYGSIGAMCLRGGGLYGGILSSMLALHTPNSFVGFLLFHLSAAALYAVAAWYLALDDQERGYVTRQLSRAKVM